MKASTIVAAIIAMLAIIVSVKAQTPPPNLPPPGGYKPIPNFTGSNAGEEFRGAVNDRLSGIEPISPRVVTLPFAALPAEQDGLSVYCSDCQKTSPCIGGGSGAFAFGQNGVWSCTGPGNALLNGQNAGGDLGGSFPNPNVATVLSGKTPLTLGMTGALLNGIAGVNSDGSDTLSGFNGAHDKEINLKAYGASGAGLLVTTASGNAGANTITVANAAGWKPNQGVIVYHGGAAVTLSVPTAPTVTVKGTPGASTCTYAIRALTTKRGYTAAGPPGTVTTCTASRTENNYEHITWQPVANAWGYAIERVSPDPALIDITTDTSTDDFGQTGAYARLQQFHEIPTTADSSTGADWLQTTITAIKGSSFTLAANLASTLNSLSYLTHDDTAPITNAYNASVANGSTLFVPAGDYFFCGAPMNGNFIRVRGSKNGARIFTCDGDFDWVLTNQMQAASKISDMTFVGGLGVVDATTSSANTAQYFNFEVDDTLVYDFTQAAIAVEASDWPFWKIDHSFFQGLDFNNTIGVVMPGSDGIQLLNSQFSLCRIGLKLGGNGDGIVVTNNTFLQPIPVYANAQKPRVGIWLSASGPGGAGKDFVSENNKYGNEGLLPLDIRNLVDSQGTGSSTSTSMPDLVELDDAAITAGAATLTSAAECPFTSAMCQGGTGCTGSAGNWGVVIQNAGRGLGAVSDALTTTITAFTNACTVTLANNANLAVSGQIARMAPANAATVLGAHFIKNEINGAGAFASAPFVVSNQLPVNVEISLNQFFNPPQEVWEQVTVPTDPFATGSVAVANTMAGGNNATIVPGQQMLSNVAGLFNKLDPNQAFNHGGGEALSIPYALAGDVGATQILGLLVSSWTTESGASLIGSIADSFGKSTGDAAEFSFSGTFNSDIRADLGVINANIPVWIYFETKAGSTLSLDRLNVIIRDQSTNNNIVFANPVTLTSGWHPWLFKWVPNSTQDEVMYFDGRWFGGVNDSGRFDVGRVRVYQGWTPPPMVDQNINGQLNVKGGLINGCKGDVALNAGSGTFSNTCVTTASACDSRDITTPSNPCTPAAPGTGSITITGTGGDVCRTWCQ